MMRDTSLSVKNRACFFGLRGSFGLGSTASTYCCASAACQIWLTVLQSERMVLGDNPSAEDAAMSL